MDVMQFMVSCLRPFDWLNSIKATHVFGFESKFACCQTFCTNTLYIYIKLATSNHSENRSSQMSTYVLYNNQSDGVLFREFE